ncbi:MAG: nucleotidyltransferase domain-containing protein [Caldilineaceae bacterium]|nr:nucleotidyltransferase domain-containing protein [Caldilineaceae bacterium]
MRSADEILTILDRTKPELERRFGVRRIGLYGSYACGTQTENSDIDLLVELQEPKFDALAGLHPYGASPGARGGNPPPQQEIRHAFCASNRKRSIVRINDAVDNG